MPPLIIYSSKETTAKGLQKTTLNTEKMQEYFFPDEYSNFQLLNKISSSIITKTIPTLFYPGCGPDIFTPLIYLEKLFTKIKEINLIFMDITDYFPTIKTMLDDVNISFTENNYNLKFYYNDLLVNFTFTEQNVFQTIPPHFDIYFEKAFRIMKDLSPEYEQKVYNNLNKEGLLISDSGYQHLPLKKISIPQELSAYQEMIIGIKSDFSTCGLSQQTNERSDIVFTGGVSNPLITCRVEKSGSEKSTRARRTSMHEI